MATMNISLPDKLKKWVEKQAKTGDFSNTSDFLREVLRREKQRREAIAEIELLIEEADASGYVEMTIDEAFAEVDSLVRKSKKEKTAA